MSKKKQFMLSNAERSILHFIWRVKVASTSSIFLRFEADFHWKETTAYKRLWMLKKKGCLDTRTDKSGSYRAWTLTSKGFEAIQHLLLALREVGSGTESATHDLYVLAAHFGEWISRAAVPDVVFITEQELRRIDEGQLPKWTRPLFTHKPDGVWYFPETKEKTLIVLEVEMSRKRNSEYQALGAFYSEEKSISAALWLVQNKGHANTIRNEFQSATSQFRDIHNFVQLEDFKKDGWASQIVAGPNSGMTIHNFLESMGRNKPRISSEETRKTSYAQRLLNFGICRFISRTSASAPKSSLRA